MNTMLKKILAQGGQQWDMTGHKSCCIDFQLLRWLRTVTSQKTRGKLTQYSCCVGTFHGAVALCVMASTLTARAGRSGPLRWSAGLLSPRLGTFGTQVGRPA